MLTFGNVPPIYCTSRYTLIHAYMHAYAYIHTHTHTHAYMYTQVVYCWQGHEKYLNAVVEQKLYPCKVEQMPWQKYKLSVSASVCVCAYGCMCAL